MTTVEPTKYTSQQRASLMELETSIRTEIVAPNGGRIVTMGFPGLAFDARGASVIDEDRLQATLGHPALERCRMLIILPELKELPDEAMDAVHMECAARGVSVEHLPIRDYEVPDEDFERDWSRMEGRINDLLEKGDTLALSCHHGAGRSGTIAAWLLIAQGLSPNDAIAAIRKQFPSSIESDMQLAWLNERARAKVGTET